jgi:hypothetical protein
LKPGWDIRINDLIPVTVDFELGVGEVNLDLQDLVVNEFKINTSVGKIVLTLPSNGHVVGEIGNPIGSIWINVPPNTALRLKAETGLTSIHVPHEYQLEGDNYVSPGYSSAENQVDLIINQAIGLVRVEKIGK